MEIAHHALYLLCGVLDMMAAFQAMVSANFKLAMMGFGVLVLFIMAGLVIYFSEKPKGQ